MSDFWSRKNLPPPTDETQSIQETVTQSMEEMDAEQVEFIEDEDDMSEVLNDANLRLEQGRLYQMVIEQNIFGETDADPKAIKNVQREIRKFARERMEIMLGMRHESAKEQTVVSSPFNDLEVVALKTIAAQMSKGATKSVDKPEVPAAPKKDGITSISGTTKPKVSIAKEFKPLPKNRAPDAAAKTKPAPKAPAGPKEQSYLNKPIEQMTPEELLAYDEARENRMKNLKADLPANMVPMPSPAEMEGMYMTRQANMISSGSSAAAALVKLLGPQ